MTAVDVRYDRDGAIIEGPAAAFLGVEFGREKNQVSEASITYPSQQGLCCEFLENIHHLDRVHIFVEGRLEWVGWISNIVDDAESGNVIVTAVDAYAWMRRRVIRLDHNFVGVDAADGFEALFDDAMIMGNPGIVLVKNLSGNLITREVIAADVQYADDVMSDLLETSVDMVVYANMIIVGGLDFGRISLSPEMFTDSPMVEKSLEPFGNSFWVVGDDDLVGTCTSTESDFPVVDRIVDAAGVTTQGEVDDIAARLCVSQDRPMVFVVPPGGGSLIPDCDIELSDLIPGLEVLFDGSGLCGGSYDLYELSRISFNSIAGQSMVSVEFAPLGASGQVFD